ncbi:unnamed protein product [Lathyrus sativus]|nr:unnamed protein product [Lathyrus sativus]
MLKRRNNTVTNVEFTGEERNRDGLIRERDFIVWVCGGKSEIKLRGGEFKGGDGKGRTLGVVEEVDDGASGAEEEEEEDEDENKPATNGATPITVATGTVVGLRTVGWAGGAVELRFCCRE